MERECALHTHAKGLLAHGECLPHPMTVALDDDPLEYLRPPPRSLDHLEVDAHAIPGGEGRRAAELSALQAVDHGAHQRCLPPAAPAIEGWRRAEDGTGWPLRDPPW